MIEWLTDTLVMTGALLALVLLVRRPVCRWFGPNAAYALWALPMIRLALPPLALPRGLMLLPKVSIEPVVAGAVMIERSEEHTSELQSLMRISYAVFCLKQNKNIS